MEKQGCYGWIGKILRVNLTDSAISLLPTQAYSSRFLGGRGIASRIYWEGVKPEVKAFDPGNHLIFMTGPLVATGIQGASRLSVVSKSPQTLPETYCFVSIGGCVGPELKRAGFDGIVITGCAKTPKYLWIHNNKVELRDASGFWGQGAYRVKEIVQRIHGEKVKFITTGVAGENKVRTAVLVGDNEAVADAGFGAVMGSKNLKALVIMGTGKPGIAYPEELMKLNKYIATICKRANTTHPDLAKSIKYVHKRQCYQCGKECEAARYRLPSGDEGIRKCQSSVVYNPKEYSRVDEPEETFFNAPILCNDYSIDTYEITNIVRWLYSSYKSGTITEKDVGLPLSKIGTREFLEKMLHSIAYREGFGDILGEGLLRAVEKIPGCTPPDFRHQITSIGLSVAEQPRAIVVFGLLYALEPAFRKPLTHQVTFPLARWSAYISQAGASPVTTRVFHNMAKVFWGSEEAGDLSTYAGKALAAKKIQDRVDVMDSLGLCDFTWPIMGSFNTPDYVGDPDLENQLFRAVTGITNGELDQFGERIFTLQRAIQAREGRRGIEFDNLPEYNFKEPLETTKLGSRAYIPGASEEPLSVKGNILDQRKFEGLRKEYYQLRGWNPETGIPCPETFNRLGLTELKSDFG